jgi:hypothetical protein
MNDLRDLFHQPTEHPIGGLSFTVYKLQFDQFADALVLGRFLEGFDADAFDLAALESLAADSPERQALKRTLAGCLSVAVPGESTKRQLQPADVDVMPALMLAEALAVAMEVNADFFFQTLPRLLQVGLRIRSTGSELLSRLSAQATAPSA